MKEQQRPEVGSTIATTALKDAVPLSHLLVHATNACDADLLSQMLTNIVVVGGTTNLPGFPDRLQNELTTMASGVCFPLSTPLLPLIYLRSTKPKFMLLDRVQKGDTQVGSEAAFFLLLEHSTSSGFPRQSMKSMARESFIEELGRVILNEEDLVL